MLVLPSTAVTPFAGVWIEITCACLACTPVSVTPFAGVWIEIAELSESLCCGIVTPFAGVWIEIFYCKTDSFCNKSLPSRECGLK